MSVVAHKVIRGALIYTIAGYASQAISFASSLILLRLLTPEHYGVFGLAVVLGSIFGRIKTWGLGQLLLAETDPNDVEISTQFWLSVGLSIIVVLVMLAAVPLLALIYSPSQVWLAVLVAAISIFDGEGVASMSETLLERDLRYDLISLIMIGSLILSLLITILLAALGLKGWALLGGLVAKTVSYCAAMLIAAPRKPKFAFSIPYARWMMSQGRKLFWGGMGSYFAFSYDDLAVGTFAGSVALGLYRKAYDWSLIPTAIVGGINGVAGATYAKVKEDRAALSQATSSMLGIVAMIALPSSVGLALISREFILALFPAAWLPAASMLQILMIFSLLRPIRESFSGLATAVKRNDVVSKIGIIQTVAMLVFCTIFTLLWGANGAALSAGLTTAAGLIVLYREILQHYVDVNYREALLMPGLATLLGAVVTIAASFVYLPAQPWPALLYKMTIFSAIYIGTLFLTARSRLLMFLNMLLGSFRRKEPVTTTAPST